MLMPRWSWIQSTLDPAFLFQCDGKIGADHFEGNQSTYLFLVALQEVIRARFPQEQDAVSRPDPKGNEVCATLIITIIQDLL